MGLLAAVAIPLSLWAPTRLARSADPRWLLFAIMACYPVGYVGLMVAPYSLAVLWAVLVGIGTVTFPLILTLIGLRARTPEGTAALSSLTQSLGYLIAAAGPFAVGALYEATDGWTVPLLLAHDPGGAALRRGGLRRPAAVHRGPAQPTSRRRSAVSCSSVIPPERR